MAVQLRKSYTLLDEAIDAYYLDPTPVTMDSIITAAHSLIYYFIRIYGAGRNDDDLYQVGVEGLLKAIKRFDLANGASFTTYAGHCIVGEIRHYMRKEASYYMPGCIAGLQYKIDREIEQSLAETGEVPSIKALADILNIKAESISEVMRAGLVNFKEINTALITHQRLETFKLPIEDKLLLAQAMKKLSDIQKKVIYYLFYMNLTQTQVAAKLGFNQRKVSRIKDKSLQILRGEMDKEEEP